MTSPSPHLAILTTGRQDWGILRTLARCLGQDPSFKVTILAGGMACDDRFGNLAHRLESEGIAPLSRIPWEICLDDDADKSREAAAALAGIAAALAKIRPDAIILVGDRFETLAAATAAVIQRVPIVHLHGGEETEGAFDNYFRHAISKLSSLHFVSHPKHRDRLLRMGEDPASVFVVGAPGIDNLYRDDLPTSESVLKDLGLPPCPSKPLFLVTYHPPTQGGDPKQEIDGLLTAIGEIPSVCVFTLPNDDPGNAYVRQVMTAFAKADPAHRAAVPALGEDRYWALLKRADVVLGNSSSGLIEAPAVPVPVINLGRRQQGRETAPCVMTLPEPTPNAISDALANCLNPSFRQELSADDAPYGCGRSTEKIHAILKGIDWHNLPPKKFHE
jgi:UDP-hydrolysing UDP-N-acetyl-D-glucosamine 2-epimerase